MCLKPYICANDLKSWLSYCGPLSVTMVCGTPYSDIMDFMLLMTVEEVVECSFLPDDVEGTVVVNH